MIIELEGYWNDNEVDFIRFAKIQRVIMDCDNDIIISFKGCKFLSPNILTLLGGLKELVEVNNKRIFFDFKSMENMNILKYLLNSGFIDYLIPELHININNKNSVAYKRFEIDDNYDQNVEDYIKEILKLIPITMTEEVEAELTSKIYEVFVNAADHSKTQIGVHACGHYFPSKGILQLSIYDGGVGIINNINSELEKKKSPEEALRWAFQSGNTTVKDIDYDRGLGLDLLKQFIRLNDGRIFTYTNNGIGTIGKSGEYYSKIETSIIGTSINITIKEDNDFIYINE